MTDFAACRETIETALGLERGRLSRDEPFQFIASTGNQKSYILKRVSEELTDHTVPECRNGGGQRVMLANREMYVFFLEGVIKFRAYVRCLSCNQERTFTVLEYVTEAAWNDAKVIA